MPLLDVVNVVVGAGVQYLATNDIASKSSSQPDYATSLNTMVNEAYQLQSSGLAKFVNLTPDGGYTGCGADLYIIGTNLSSGAVTTSPANQTLTQAVNTTQNMYEASVKTTYQIPPLVSFAAIPGFSTVPGLGMPATFTFSANRPIEHPAGLETIPTGAVGNNVTPFNRILATTVAPPTGSGTIWRNPNIYLKIQQAGQTVVTTNVFTVQANTIIPTDSGVNVAPGQKLYIDTQAVGQWNNASNNTGSTYCDANGVWDSAIQSGLYFPTLPSASLAGGFGPLVIVGSTPPIPTIPGTGFLVGDSQMNYSPSGTGELFMVNNDSNLPMWYADNVGAQVVRVIVVQ
jgi:hypothetical protein